VDNCALIGMLLCRNYKKSLQNKAQYSSIIGNDNMKHKLQIMHQLRNLRTC